MSKALEEKIVKARVNLIRRSPFFGTLLLNAPWRFEESTPTAATDGRHLKLNPKFVEQQTDEELRGLLVHEVLHMALQHVDRLKDVFATDPVVANIAADIVVNGIADDNKIKLPANAVRDNKLKHLSVREIYNILKQKQSQNKSHVEQNYGSGVNQCLVKPEDNGGGKDQDGNGGDGGQEEGGSSGSQSQDDAPNWPDILRSAATIAKMKSAGPVGAGLDRLFSELLSPTLDWRTLLYKYLTTYPTDFTNFDRRFVFRNLYLDDFDGTKLTANIYIDTSGSVDQKILTEFLSEVQGAIATTEHTEGVVYCFDTKLYRICDVPELDPSNFTPRGGGGTSFRPIFDLAANPTDNFAPTLHIILTDGYADLNLPAPAPSDSVLWVISPGGVDSDSLPHGDVVRIML